MPNSVGPFTQQSEYLFYYNGHQPVPSPIIYQSSYNNNINVQISSSLTIVPQPYHIDTDGYWGFSFEAKSFERRVFQLVRS